MGGGTHSLMIFYLLFFRIETFVLSLLVMKQEIRHRRLHAFYNSVVLNSLMLVIVVSLLMSMYLQTMLLPALCGSIALLLFIGYSLWLWIKKPRSIAINYWLSNINSFYILYYLVVSALYPVNQWWMVVPIALSVIALYICLTGNHNTKFDISL